eukprot:scaffold66299_cov52-Phaeocystis_antarctica.AAC.1
MFTDSSFNGGIYSLLEIGGIGSGCSSPSCEYRLYHVLHTAYLAYALTSLAANRPRQLDLIVEVHAHPAGRVARGRRGMDVDRHFQGRRPGLRARP